MKKKLLYMGMILPLLLPTSGTVSYAAPELSRKQVYADLQKWMSHTTQKSTNTPLIKADEWLRLGTIFKGEAVQQTGQSALQMIEADKAWKELGVKGEGTLISIVDTGVNSEHPDFPNPVDKQAAMQKSGVAKKVIPGYNWADRNQSTYDVGESQHGVHVAGIAAGNGKIKGAAPEAQLLSEKVFSNYQGSLSGLSESILFAITDSIQKKADVINLSLGSTAGYVDESNTEQYAVKNAVDSGVVVVAAAGNDSYFGSEKVKENNPDYAMIGSPSIAPDAFSVASVNANTLAGTSFLIGGADEQPRVVYIAGTHTNGLALQSEQILSNSHQVIYVGKGKKEDYNVNVKGKVVLIERGDITFDEKLKLAREAGAVGAIIYNNLPGPFMMSANETKMIPAVSILQSTGQAMATKLKKGKAISVTFDGQFAQNDLPFPEGGTVSSFTSWGPTPNLQFKPEIAAPGGGILSTVNKEEYGVKSGTSMATPHIAGGMALLKQYYKKQGYSIAGREMVETMKAAVMNTAMPVLDPRDSSKDAKKAEQVFPYSPRVQGAGIMQVVKAAKTPVIITDHAGKAGVSLGEIGKKTTFKLKLTNKFGKEAITYQLTDEYGVLTDKTENGYFRMKEMRIPGATLQFSTPSIKVPPGASKEVSVTLTLPNSMSKDRFAEGYLLFTPKEQQYPALRVPYYGFYGDWDEPRVMDVPMWEKESQEKVSSVKSSWYHDRENDKWRYQNVLGVNGVDEHGNILIDPERIAFSPNGDGHFDKAGPSITFLRNARELSIVVTDTTGKQVRSLVQDAKVNKYDQSKKGASYYFTEKEEWSWDGMLYSQKKGSYVPAPDGAYQFVIRAKNDSPNAKWQTISMPIRVDRQAPTLTATLDKNVLSWQTKDKDVQGFLLYVNGKKAGGPFAPTMSKTIVTQPKKKMTLVAYDYAGNMSFTYVNGQGDQTPPAIEFPDEIFEQVVNTNQPQFAVRGTITGEEMMDRVRLTINKQPVKVESDGRFQTVLSLAEGLQYVTYQAQDGFKNVREFTQRVIVDKTAPILQVVNDGSEDLLYDPVTKKAVIPIRMMYRDMNYKGKVKVNGKIAVTWEEDQLEKSVNKYVSQPVSLEQGENKILLEGIDGANNSSSLVVHAYTDAYSGAVVLQQGEKTVTYRGNQASPLTLQFTKPTYTDVVGESLQVTGKMVKQTDTEVSFYYGDQHLFGDISENGEFRVDIPEIKEGKETLTVMARDLLGREKKGQITVTGLKSQQRTINRGME
ncbi:S8 family serine peptidase [Brevibacillus daliensis]|uniref:S8 family serine peptidase n=1 Tax=Brevibacillus daliensis TaxID=2892995 RepID=UPI001E46561E|nr:S8 family serine peptidase [Brevibacillus daliensis]